MILDWHRAESGLEQIDFGGSDSEFEAEEDLKEFEAEENLKDFRAEENLKEFEAEEKSEAGKI